jgi:hypothetical protein
VLLRHCRATEFYSAGLGGHSQTAAYGPASIAAVAAHAGNLATVGLWYAGISPQRTGRMALSHQQKPEVLPPRNAVALDTLAGVRSEMARLYRLGLNGRIRSDEMTRFIYALKEIRACLEAELLTDVQRRLVLLSRDMDNHNGHRVAHQPALASR